MMSGMVRFGGRVVSDSVVEVEVMVELEEVDEKKLLYAWRTRKMVRMAKRASRNTWNVRRS